MNTLKIKMSHTVNREQVTFHYSGRGNNALAEFEAELTCLLNEAYQRGQEDMRIQVTTRDPFPMFAEWLAWLDSQEGMEYRLENCHNGGNNPELDCLGLIPKGRIFTVGHLRSLVEAGRELEAAKRETKRIRTESSNPGV